ncbi:transcriptional regulator family: Fungal Specific TF [Trichoderma aggressivum f. europaeum]|uniref:Transcriptional regulator family: Fungal Specific TF n=1 Tax=Trichoderma aggressivum f. europaeum TaxID=173218 RepID=A0AAE1M0B4_9HYPO|nr:transcriptional regulator family: Fungal Specific TF [Trichoderma aggressivum f. europaeum]
MDAASIKLSGSPHASRGEGHEGNGGSQPKRRKVRKGTRSCWECRRRKMKCVFGSPANTACISCKRRGAKCVDQQFPEQISTPLDRSLQMGDRVVRVEALVEQLLNKASSTSDPCPGSTTTQDNGKSRDDIISPTTNSPVLSQLHSWYEHLNHDETAQYEILDCDGSSRPLHRIPDENHSIGIEKHLALSSVLYESLPTPQDIEIIAKARGDLSSRFYQMLTVPYNDLDRSDSQQLDSLLERPGSNAHPVLIGLYMLRIATFLQHLHPDLHSNITGLSEPPRQMMSRLFSTAISLVTMNESLISSIEGLECVMLESLWYTNGGNLRKGLVAIRRAMTIAQLMGLHRSSMSPPRRLFAERHLCLMLGLPQSTVDQSMASKDMLENDTPMGRLDRMHCVIASRILQRNQSDPSSHDFALMLELDEELQKAAEDLPKRWWLHSNLATTLDDPETLFWDMRRLFHQLFHYTLLNQLHLPYMLRSSINGRDYQYSRITCVNASREVLLRFITFRSSDRIAFWCRTLDFLSLMAAMTLLIAHLDGHRQASMSSSRAQLQQAARSENLLTHQRPGDRAMIEQVQESMEEVSRRNEDALGARSAELLRRLLSIEAEAAGGHRRSVDSVTVRLPATVEDPAGEANEEMASVVSVYIPYFGTVKIAHGGIISKETPTAQTHLADRVDQGQIQASQTDFSDDTVEVLKAWSNTPVNRNSNNSRQTDTDVRVGKPSVLAPSAGDYNNATQEISITEGFLQQEEDLLFTNGADDWVYQSVDMARFDTLMRDVGDDAGEIPDRWGEQNVL